MKVWKYRGGNIKNFESSWKKLFYFIDNFLRVSFKYRENPSITQKEISKELQMTRDGVKYNMNVLKEMNIISREGSTKKGKWKILK